jgi:hypothetical protein
MVSPEPIPSSPPKNRSKTNSTPIPILFDSDGCPELPTVTMPDGYKTKVVQSMLREYCTAHIREPSLKSCEQKYDTSETGFVSGRTKQIIPWGAFVKDPYSWISEECVPHEFEWKDPSKIQIGEIFRLLYHWRHRQGQGLDPLIWSPTCPVLQSTERPLRHGRNLRQRRVQQPQDSEEETFDLAAGGDLDEIDESSDEQSHGHKSLDESPIESDSSEDEDSIDLDPPPIHMSHLEQGISSEYHIHTAMLVFTSYVPSHAVSPEGDGRSAVPQYNQPNISRSSSPGQSLIYILSILLIRLKYV